MMFCHFFIFIISDLVTSKPINHNAFHFPFQLGYFKRKRKAEEDQIENNGKHDVVDYADDNKEDPNETSPLQNENKNNTQEELDYVTDNDETEQVRENTSFSRR